MLEICQVSLCSCSDGSCIARCDICLRHCAVQYLDLASDRSNLCTLKNDSNAEVLACMRLLAIAQRDGFLPVSLNVLGKLALKSKPRTTFKWKCKDKFNAFISSIDVVYAWLECKFLEKSHNALQLLEVLLKAIVSDAHSYYKIIHKALMCVCVIPTRCEEKVVGEIANLLLSIATHSISAVQVEVLKDFSWSEADVRELNVAVLRACSLADYVDWIPNLRDKVKFLRDAYAFLLKILSIKGHTESMDESKKHIVRKIVAENLSKEQYTKLRETHELFLLVTLISELETNETFIELALQLGCFLIEDYDFKFKKLGLEMLFKLLMTVDNNALGSHNIDSLYCKLKVCSLCYDDFSIVEISIKCLFQIILISPPHSTKRMEFIRDVMSECISKGLQYTSPPSDIYNILLKSLHKMVQIMDVVHNLFLRDIISIAGNASKSGSNDPEIMCIVSDIINHVIRNNSPRLLAYYDEIVASIAQYWKDIHDAKLEVPSDAINSLKEVVKTLKKYYGQEMMEPRAKLLLSLSPIYTDLLGPA